MKNMTNKLKFRKNLEKLQKTENMCENIEK